jgi:phage tail-like protein
VEIDGITRSAFESVSGLAGFAQVADYREGGDRVTHKEIGEVSYENITLRAGLDNSRELYDWWQTVASGLPARKSMSVVLFSGSGQEVARWNVSEAVPVRYEVSGLDVRESDIVYELLEIAHEGIARCSQAQRAAGAAVEAWPYLADSTLDGNGRNSGSRRAMKLSTPSRKSGRSKDSRMRSFAAAAASAKVRSRSS